MAENSTELRDDVNGFLTTQWGLATPAGTPLFYDGQESNRPDVPGLFGRLHIRHFQGSRANLGPSGRFRRPGRIYLQVFTPVGTGMKSLDQVSSALVEALEDAGAIGNIWFRDIGAREVGNDGTYEQVNVECDFTYDRLT